MENIQKLNLKNNMGTLIDIILIAGRYKKEFVDIPDYSLEFKPLWSLSENEQATVEQMKAATELTKAQTAQLYVDMQALDASEIRQKLAESGEFTINDILDEEDADWSELENVQSGNIHESEETSNTALFAENETVGISRTGEMAEDSVQPTGCGVIVMKGGKVLIGERKDNGLICGPGGHIETGETPEDAAIRETREEFGINVANIVPIAVISGMPAEYCPSQVFLCTEYYGEPVCFNTEMENARFEAVADIMKCELFLPFRLSLQELLRNIAEVTTKPVENGLTHLEDSSNMEADGGPGSGRYPKGSGEKKGKSLPMTKKEKIKVGHDINNLYHSKYEGKRNCWIKTRSNETDSPFYIYRFKNHGFDNYDIFSKAEYDD